MKCNCLNKIMLENLEGSILESMKKRRVPGVSLALIENNKVVCSKSFGVKNALHMQSVENNTIFEAASLTKPLVAYAALKLHDRGVINLDTPLFKYLEEPCLKEEPLSELITTRHILSHSCGLPNWRGEEKLKVQFKPGDKFCYSGEGFVYLQRVIEEITGETLDEHIKKNVFIPFKMTDSSLVWIDKYEHQAAYPHNEKGEPQEFRKEFNANAAWSLYTNPYEYAKFVIEIIDANKHLSMNSIEEMFKPQSIINEYLSWGLGWGIEHSYNQNSYWHWGDNGEYKAFTLFIPREKSGIVIMTNGYNGLNTCKDIINMLIGDCYAFSKYLDIE